MKKCKYFGIVYGKKFCYLWIVFKMPKICDNDHCKYYSESRDGKDIILTKHNASFYGIPCYYYTESNVLEGRNSFFEFLMNMMIVFHCGFSFISEALTGRGLDFPIHILEDDCDETKRK